MALDLGELSARVTVEGVNDADRDLNTFERKLLQVARTQVPDIAVAVATGVAEGALNELEAQLRGLPDGEAEVDTDTRAAAGSLDDIAAKVRGLPDGEVDVDVNEPDFDPLTDGAGKGGRDAGDAAGEGLSAGILAAIATIPIAGGIVLAGAAIGRELVSGLQGEVREDTLVARTGLDPDVAARIGRAAGEAYAANFGTSIEANFDTARAAVQGGLLDPQSTARDSQAVIQSLSGVSDILGEDIPRVVRAVSVLLRSGLAGSAEEAFDLLVKGQQTGANQAEDLLDTFTEYPAVLERLGLSGQDALGLISQGLQNGARDSDFVADALKEFQIRATDGSELSAAGFRRLGLDAEDTTAKIARGGAEARAGLDEVLDGLRGIEDPVERNAAAVELFGTKAEDLGDALFALDLDTVAADLGKVEGAASGAITALGDNAAGSLESAQRNIEVAKDGILAALAEAFGPQIEGFAEDITGNREKVIGFLLDVANGGIDVARILVGGAADATEAFGDFVSTAGPGVLDLIGTLLSAFETIPGVDLSEQRAEFDSLRLQAAGAFGEFDADTAAAADAIRTNLITNGLDPAQARLNEVGFDLQTQARFTDATTALAGAIGDIGFAADGTKVAIDFVEGTFDTATESGRLLDDQLRAASDALDAQALAGIEAGRTQEDLTADYAANREELIRQLEAMGLTREEAERLAAQYGATPELVVTNVRADGLTTTIAQLDDLTTKLTRIDGDVINFTVRQRNEETGRINVSTVQARAGGGPVVQGEPYLVGEEGPELIVAPTDGFVIPAGPTASILSGGYGEPTPLGLARPQLAESSASVTRVREGDTFNIYETTSPRDTAEAINVKQRIAEVEASL